LGGFLWQESEKEEGSHVLPHVIFGSTWTERNRGVFEGVETPFFSVWKKFLARLTFGLMES